jgi:CheY-like chemotaxis protein/HPt (histidine-containing phosphotransfer) domain-containing protein
MMYDNPSGTTIDQAKAGETACLRILVAEDNQVNQQIARILLTKLGHTVAIANNGLEAVELLRQGQYDAVFMDIQMPEMDGVEATRLVRAELPHDAQPRIIALTANTDPESKAEYTTAGMDDIVNKPFTVNDIRQALERCMAARAKAGAGTKEYEGQEASPPENETFDPSVLQEFENEMGEDGRKFTHELVGLFLSECPKIIERLKAGYSQNLADEVNKAAHSLKGNSLQVGANALAKICQRIELDGTSGRLESCDMIASVEAEFSRASERLKRAYPGS